MDTRPDSSNDLGSQLNLTIWLLSALATIFLSMRIYCKLWRHRSLWWDDYVLVASWVSLIVSVAVQSATVPLGLGKHTSEIDPKNFRLLAMFSYIAGFASILAAVWAKTSFAMTLLRICDGWTRRLVWFIIITINMIMGASAALQFLQCWPVEKLWNHSIAGSCLKSSAIQDYDLFMSAYSGTMDIVLAVLPWKIFRHAHIDRKEKYGALFAMSMAVFAGISSFLKITALFSIGNSDVATTVVLFIFGTAEGAVTIMAASIPILRALFQPQARPRQPPTMPAFVGQEETDVAASRLRDKELSLQE